MICKFFRNEKGAGGGIPSVDYLLNKQRVKNGTARILKGDESLTREIIKSLDYKQKACVGCLSFEEKNIDEDLKKEIMESFENVLLTPEMKGRFNILWVEHTDKGRLELNFIIPKIDLETKKSFNPYFHKIDFKRVDLWGDMINLSYGFSNPKDPAKEQNIKNINHHAKTFKDHKALDNHFKELAINGLIKNRDELINYIEKELNGIEITRKGEDYLSLKLPNDKKATRYKGELYQDGNYADTFRQENERKQREARELGSARNGENIARLKTKLNELIEYKVKFLRERYKTKARENSKQHREYNNDINMETSFNNSNSNLNNQHNTLFLDSKSENVTERMGESNQQENNHHTKTNDRDTRNRNRDIYNSEGIKNESNREHINRFTERKRRAMRRERPTNTSIREYERRKQEANARAREFSEKQRRLKELYNRARERNNELERTIKEQIRNRIANTARLRKRAKKLSIERLIKSFKKFQFRLKNNETKYTRQQQLRERIQGIIKSIQDIRDRAIKRRNSTRNIQELFKRFRDNFSRTTREVFASSGFRIEEELKKPERQRFLKLKRERQIHRMR
ncbi:relaxase/mobilization nuclease domain-containing protein [Campylobacter jejuni]|uniref:relaxase/mobilization nuclease domain-containing protein n=1 Tax=Campylobacter jejuni TaxID=197 RepID=UPI000F8125EF|nr:relaxase/mobilization nuclease domain-containing protein [Campylobacter jejuni]RTJ03028.1 mobilization protein [Campylobacter jejuni]RTJ30250.1 mobilization protein [Campylobacter jejuni]RTJ44563.1 mobilization protein [Campylobacter jejuni]